MKKIFLLLLITIVELNNIFAQENLAEKLKNITKKGDYIILELRLNNEDEFKTIEGGESSLTRIAVFTGTNQGVEVIKKGFGGINNIVAVLNNLKSNGWQLNEVYSLKGESLIITHYLLERKK